MAQKIKVVKKPVKKGEARFRKRIRQLEAGLFCLWEYISSEGLAEEAREYLAENADRGVPFSLE